MSAILDAWLNIGSLRIHYLHGGSGRRSLVLVHGGGLDAASLSFKFILGPLSERYSVYAPDLPGYGGSDAPEVGITTAYYVRFLRDFLDQLSITDPCVLGLSLGGATGLGLALDHPQLVRELVLVDSHGLGWGVPFGWLSPALVRLSCVNRSSWALIRRSRLLMRLSLKAIVHDPSVVDDGLVEEAMSLLRRPKATEAWRQWQRSEILSRGLSTNYVPRLHKLSCNTLILHGEKDTLVPVSWARRAHALIPYSRLCIVPDCGHWLPREKPSELLSCLLTFMDGADGPTARP